ncbi:lytic transglycosylase domain-containing protein [Desulforamulus aeronauticus]|uniref:Transglycosylase SLT domain-containing protein n=1 Tax=Desulforamulus aeronauticus DSM 10349 TaxID=1121421 RepID=A0A1M6WFA5_9FIRM|nr:lytic transglycosylase domain-containing protein [Desulforamulus aeronauticus]SHK92450.1 Transglycosylase SLT domain-containing protein [Desulforamulus aeronauticus DSM 10349]
MRGKVFILSIIVTLAISNVAFANQIDCGVISPSIGKVASVDCISLNKTLVKPAEVNAKEQSLNYVPEVSKRILSKVNVFRHDIHELIIWAANEVGISPRLLGAVANAESSGNQAARSPKGAVGVMQLLPSTAKALGVNPYNPKENVFGGATYLKQQIDRYQGNIPKALAAYNAGPGAVDKYNGIPPYKETQKYVHSIMTSIR